MTDYKQLCAELAQQLDDALDFTVSSETRRYMKELVGRARTALAEPEPEGPTVMEIIELADEIEESGLGQVDLVRAALARWGNHPGSPDSSGNLKAELTGSPADDEMAELATAEMVRRLRTKAATEKANRCHYSAKLLTRAADLLERLSPPQPIPVSERLPGPEDCDAEGRCWIYMPDIGTDPSWRLVDPRDIGPYHTHWLPAHALPTPGDKQQ